jgi:pimeloyl-ACP methyl ester carboxylesterase
MVLALCTPPDVIVGISLGGFVAMRFVAEHPELVRRFVLLSSAHRFSPGGQRMMRANSGRSNQGDFRTLVSETALLFRRLWYNWRLQLKLWLEGIGSPLSETRPRFCVITGNCLDRISRTARSTADA